MNRPSYRFEPILSLNALSRALSVDRSTLEHLAATADGKYRLAKPIPKSDGTFRRPFDAHAPLKDVHRAIKTKIFSGVNFPEYLTGSLKNRDYRVNARRHAGARLVICEDIEKFFPTTSRNQVKAIWLHLLGFSEDVAECLTQLTTKDGYLPEGAITSSYLANLSLWCDEPELVERFEAQGLIYTRYVDDITVSSHAFIGPEIKSRIIADVYGMLRKNGYSAKRRKHEIASSKDRMIVTKLAINKDIGMPKAARHKVRAALYELEKQLQNPSASINVKKQIASIEGRINNLASLHPREGGMLKERLNRIRAAAGQWPG